MFHFFFIALAAAFIFSAAHAESPSDASASTANAHDNIDQQLNNMEAGSNDDLIAQLYRNLSPEQKAMVRDAAKQKLEEIKKMSPQERKALESQMKEATANLE